jgi:hypothetical protein
MKRLFELQRNENDTQEFINIIHIYNKDLREIKTFNITDTIDRNIIIKLAELYFINSINELLNVFNYTLPEIYDNYLDDGYFELNNHILYISWSI